MLKKCYVGNCIRNGELCGYVTCTVWFWVPPYEVVDYLHAAAKAIHGNVVDIRRLK